MKRCPVCEFLYEDDQSLCDMDGMALVIQKGPLPFERNASSHRDSPANRSLWRILTLAIVSSILGVILFLDYHNLRDRRPVPNNELASTQKEVLPATVSHVIVEEEAAPTPEASPSPSPTPSPSVSPAPSTVKPRSSHRSSLAPKETKKNASKTSNANHRNDSKVTSFLKNTGRLLKKPFKL